MANTASIIALSLAAAASPLAGASARPNGTVAPPGGPQTLYCLRVAPVTGSMVETTHCWTRDHWAQQGVQVDKEWAKNGVKVIG